ncbi:MAG: putative methylase [Actinomycetota bacterium]|nr:putative methylase [Actinomycetota bacterium]
MRATYTSIDALARGIFMATAGKARLLSPGELDRAWDPTHDDRISDREVRDRLAAALMADGVRRASALMAAVRGRVDLDTCKDLV